MLKIKRHAFDEVLIGSGSSAFFHDDGESLLPVTFLHGQEFRRMSEPDHAIQWFFCQSSDGFGSGPYTASNLNTVLTISY